MQSMEFAYLVSVFVIATCGLIYELITGALASYLLGDSVTQFSTVIGVYLFSMGIGSYLSKFIKDNLVSTFIKIEILIGLVGGSSAALLFVIFEHVISFRLILYGVIGLTGVLVGLEIPILMRLLKDRFEFKDLVSKIFTFDYIGALAASLLFPLVLVPHLGLIRSAYMFGIFNVAVGVWTIHIMKLKKSRPLRFAAYAALTYLVSGFIASDRILSFAEAVTYPDQVIYAKSSVYQRIVITKESDDLRLYLNGNLQFSSRDEYRYHEALVHPGLSSLENPKSVLVLGGGDGMAAREILKYPSIENITLVDLDSSMTDLFKSHDSLTVLNHNSLNSPKVHLENADAFVWLQSSKRTFDFIVVDFPDPTNFSVGKLYTTSFYKLLYDVLSPSGVAVIQSTSPYVAKKSFWCIDSTLTAVGFKTTPYHAYVPSFGEWGYDIATKAAATNLQHLPSGLKFISKENFTTMQSFPDDMRVPVATVNRLNNQVLVRTFEEEWAKYTHF
jgi:spermidine synthase